MKNTTTKYKKTIVTWIIKSYPSSKDNNQILKYCYP